MTVKKILLLCFIVFLSIQLFSNFDVNYYKLHNGLTVILSPEKDAGSICIMVYHKNGVRDDPAAIRGASYLYQSLMFLGTQNLAPYERILFTKNNGGRSSGRVNYDNSIFYQVVPDNDINYALWIESERLKSLDLSDRNITEQKNKIYRRIYNISNRSVNFRAMSWIHGEIYRNTLYSTPLHGELEKINSFDNNSIRNLYTSFTNPKNIIIVISGHFEENDIREKIERYFSGLSSSSRHRPSREIIPSEMTKGYVYKNWMRELLPEHFILYGIKAPSKLNLDHLYFNFIKYYLVDKRISKLDRIFKSNLKMDINISYEYSDNIGANALVIKVASPKRAEIEKARFYLNRVFLMLQTDRLTSSEIKTIKSLMEIDYLKKISTPEGRCLILAENFHMSGSLDKENSFIRRLRRINAYDLLRISKKYLVKKNLVILNVFSK